MYFTNLATLICTKSCLFLSGPRLQAWIVVGKN